MDLAQSLAQAQKACLAEGARLKTNQAYIWGLTESNRILWFSTVANTLCLVTNGPGIDPYQTTAWTCEGTDRDFRPPRIFTYDPILGRLTDKTSLVLAKSDTDKARLGTTTGLRSAGSHDGVVFLGGIGPDGVVNDSLVWGTMFVPGSGGLAFEKLYPNAPADDAAAFLGTARPTTIFRATNPGTVDQKVELLYGNAQLPKFNPAPGTGPVDPRNNPNANPDEWYLVPNGLGLTPLMGPAGIGSFVNNYTWWMTTHQDKLLIGTMDYLYVAARVGDLAGSCVASVSAP